jgi:pullulanase
MTIIQFKKVALIATVTTALSACGGGSSDGGDKVKTPGKVNNTPTMTSFSHDIIESSPNEIVYSWSVTDSDGDALSCQLSPGNGLTTVTIDDCANNTSTTVTSSGAGNYQASLTVTDPSNASATASLTFDIATAGLPAPMVTAGDNELVIFYNRADTTYSDWIIHLWNNETCDAYANADTDWATGQAQTGLDPNYGAYWLIDLKAGYGDCANFIIHKGDDKDLGGIDHQADLSGDRMTWTLSGISDVYTEPTLLPTGILINDVAAHWANENTVFWNAGINVAKVRIYSSATDDLAFDGESGIPGDNFLEYLPAAGAEHPAISLNMPRYKDLAAFTATSASVSKAKSMLSGKLLAISYASDDSLIAATYLQTPRILDALYTSANNDANEADLGIIYSASEISAKLWAPTAQQVTLKVYNASKALQSSHTMSLDAATGIWSFTAPNTVDRLFYRYELTVYHQQNQRIEKIEATDPYSISLSTNGDFSQFVNLADSDLKPIGWDSHTIPEVVNPEDSVIYEGHIRDFSILDASTRVENRGNYLAFTEETSVPVTHLKSLADAGLTHFQLLPANDIASINEDAVNRINLDNTVSELCAKKSDAPVCGVENASDTLAKVFASYDPTSTAAQALAESLRGLDSFNWGYDPEHFTTPDGSYSSNPDGVARITEMRAMNQALHEMGLRVVLDVVYNHTNSSGLWENSVLDKVVPGYYHRRDLTSGNVETATCCQDTAPEHEMMHKLMQDSLLTWSQAYKFDGFRFDIMSNNSKASILSARTAVQAIDTDNYFYGEGWTRDDKGYQQADQNNMTGSQVGTFNDRPRDIIRSASLFKSAGSLNDQDIIRLGLAGTQKDYQLQDKNDNIKAGSTFSKPSYGKDPADIINYVSKHDNETLWDQLQYGIETEVSLNDRVRIQNIAGTLALISQGIPFFQLGGDLLRSKSMDRNTYDAGDWFNRVDFTMSTNNWNVGLPLAQDNESKWSLMTALINNSETAPQASDIEFSSNIFKEFLSIRASSPLFRLTTQADINARLGFHNTGSKQTQGLIVMSIDDGNGLTDLDENIDALVVVINGTASTQSHDILTATGFELHSVQQSSADTNVQTASFVEASGKGTFSVPALTTAVFIKPQAMAQGVGLAADATLNAPDPAPYGETSIYLRGSMNNWGDDGLTAIDMFTYQGNGDYVIDFTLAVGTHIFKVGSDDWAAVDLAFSDVTFTDNSITASADNSGNIEITTTAAGNYNFSLNASTSTPSLTIVSKNTTVDCAALVDSSDDIPFDINGSGQLFVRGDHSAWNATEEFRLNYKGNNQYQAVAEFDGAMQFKLASDDGSWTTQLWVQENDSNDIEGENLALGINYPVAYNNAGDANNNTTLAAGSYSFLLTLDSANPSKGYNVGRLAIQECQP